MSDRAPWLDLPDPPVATFEHRQTRLAHFHQPPNRVAEHVAPVHTLCINTGGVTRLDATLFGKRTISRSRPGDISLYPAGVPQAFGWQEPVRFLQLYFEPTYLDRLCATLHGGAATFTPRELSADRLVVHLVRTIARASANKARTHEHYVESLAEALAMHLVQAYSNRPPKPRRLTGRLSNPVLQRVCDHIESHLAEAITVEELAAIACLSVAHFSRAFRARTGQSPHRFHLERRLRWACVLLGASEATVASIALTVGFSSQSHFTRHFSCRHGMPPGEYRRRQQIRASPGQDR